MSHHIYSTDALIMNIFPDGEESVIAECLTADLGRIYVHIQGAKKIENKHRMHVFPFALVVLDCVQGKHYYRCTGISERVYLAQDLKHMSSSRRKMIQTVFGMVQRLVPSGIPIPEVFAAFEKFFTQILDKNLGDQEAQILLLVVQLRILGILGYWNSEWSDNVLDQTGKTFQYVSENTISVRKLIDRILIETQMHERIPS
jgi:recombinational DNA repair protein (RecF pathway)